MTRYIRLAWAALVIACWMSISAGLAGLTIMSWREDPWPGALIATAASALLVLGSLIIVVLKIFDVLEDIRDENRWRD